MMLLSLPLIPTDLIPLSLSSGEARQFYILINATIGQPWIKRLTRPDADRKIAAVDLAFYLPGRFDRTQPGAVWHEEPKGGKGSSELDPENETVG